MIAYNVSHSPIAQPSESFNIASHVTHAFKKTLTRTHKGVVRHVTSQAKHSGLEVSLVPSQIDEREHLAAVTHQILHCGVAELSIGHLALQYEKCTGVTGQHRAHDSKQPNSHCPIHAEYDHSVQLN